MAKKKEQIYNVRVKPLDKRRGYKVRTIFVRGKRYKEGEWHAGYPEWLAKELGDLRQSDDPEKFVFDVVTVEEAARIEEAEEQAELKGKKASHAHKFDPKQHRGADAAQAEAEAEAEAPAASDEAPAEEPPAEEKPKTSKRRPRRAKARSSEE